MARQGIFTGSSPNDGTGDSLVVGAVKVNQNFSEIYNTFGNGTNLISYVNNAGVATVAQGLSGTPNLNVGVVTATFFYGDGSNLTGVGGLGTESDPIFTSSVAFGISATNISNWNTAYSWGNHATVGYTTQGYVTNALVGYATQGYVANALVGYATQGYVTTQIGLNTFTGAASTITSGQISNWNTAYSWGNHAAVGYVTSLTLNQLVDVNVGGPSTGQVLKWSGTEWEAASDLTASGGAGIGLSDLSVTITASGINSLTYNNTTGVFLFTPTSLVGYATQGYVTTQIGLNTFTGAASTITTTNISNWNTAYSWGNHASAGYLTNVNITAGSNITVLEVSEGNFIITSTSIAGAGGTWTVNAVGIHTTKNVGIGTTLSTSALTVEGDGRFSGVVTATRFQSTSAGTPTIDSPNNLNINAVTVAISTDVTVGRELTVSGITTINGGGIRVAGIITATSFIGDVTGTASTASFAATAYSLVGTAATASFATTAYSLVGTAATASFATTAYSLVGTASTASFAATAYSILGSPNLNLGITTATSFRTNSTVGDGTDVGFAIKYYITSSGSSAYRFAGPGIVNTADNPTIYLHRGFTYIFENSTGGSHPFAIRYSSGGTGYGATYLSGSQSGTQVFTVPFDAPATLVYQCTIHSGMLGTFNIVT